mmetsp:Transcript_21199/g.46179  ORF Transcript_21199/g.46179 Transcript_21199/m.46179 type:complete len:267 (-) Transcript_21199:669-1469(-)
MAFRARAHVRARRVLTERVVVAIVVRLRRALVNLSARVGCRLVAGLAGAGAADEVRQTRGAACAARCAAARTLGASGVTGGADVVGGKGGCRAGGEAAAIGAERRKGGAARALGRRGTRACGAAAVAVLADAAVVGEHAIGAGGHAGGAVLVRRCDGARGAIARRSGNAGCTRRVAGGAGGDRVLVGAVGTGGHAHAVAKHVGGCVGQVARGAVGAAIGGSARPARVSARLACVGRFVEVLSLVAHCEASAVVLQDCAREAGGAVG